MTDHQARESSPSSTASDGSANPVSPGARRPSLSPRGGLSRLVGLVLLVVFPTVLFSYIAYFKGASAVIGTEVITAAKSKNINAEVRELEDRYVRSFLMANITQQELARVGFEANKRVLEWYLVREQASFWFVQGGSLIILLFGLLVYLRSVEDPSGPDQHAFEMSLGPASIRLKTRSLGIAAVILSLGTVSMNANFSKSATVKITSTGASSLPVASKEGTTLDLVSHPYGELDLSGLKVERSDQPSATQVVQALKSETLITDQELMKQLTATAMPE